jgi:uncharacterized C2H2 Zn-finger protein
MLGPFWGNMLWKVKQTKRWPTFAEMLDRPMETMQLTKTTPEARRVYVNKIIDPLEIGSPTNGQIFLRWAPSQFRSLDTWIKPSSPFTPLLVGYEIDPMPKGDLTELLTTPLTPGNLLEYAASLVAEADRIRLRASALKAISFLKGAKEIQAKSDWKHIGLNRLLKWTKKRFQKQIAGEPTEWIHINAICQSKSLKGEWFKKNLHRATTKSEKDKIAMVLQEEYLTADKDWEHEPLIPLPADRELCYPIHEPQTLMQLHQETIDTITDPGRAWLPVARTTRIEAWLNNCVLDHIMERIADQNGESGRRIRDFLQVIIMNATHQTDWHKSALTMLKGRNTSVKHILMAIPIWLWPIPREDASSCRCPHCYAVMKSKDREEHMYHTHGFNFQELANGQVVSKGQASSLHVTLARLLSTEVWTLGKNRFACAHPLCHARLDSEANRDRHNEAIHGGGRLLIGQNSSVRFGEVY